MLVKKYSNLFSSLVDVFILFTAEATCALSKCILGETCL
jgi:hypothetical protein